MSSRTIATSSVFVGRVTPRDGVAGAVVRLEKLLILHNSWDQLDRNGRVSMMTGRRFLVVSVGHQDQKYPVERGIICSINCSLKYWGSF